MIVTAGANPLRHDPLMQTTWPALTRFLRDFETGTDPETSFGSLRQALGSPSLLQARQVLALESTTSPEARKALEFIDRVQSMRAARGQTQVTGTGAQDVRFDHRASLSEVVPQFNFYRATYFASASGPGGQNPCISIADDRNHLLRIDFERPGF